MPPLENQGRDLGDEEEDCGGEDGIGREARSEGKKVAWFKKKQVSVAGGLRRSRPQVGCDSDSSLCAP